VEQRFGWSRRLASIVLVIALVVVAASRWCWWRRSPAPCAGPATTSRRSSSRPGTAASANLIDKGSGSLDALSKHAGDITRGVGTVSGGLAHVGVSALGAVTLVFSVVFLTLFGLIDEPHLRDWTAGLLYRDKRERYLSVTRPDRSRYMLGDVAISVICGTVYGITAVILGLPYPLALAVIAAILYLIPNVGATIAGIIIGIVALSVSVEALIVLLIVIVAYQQVENYILQRRSSGRPPGSPASPCSRARSRSDRSSGWSARSSASPSRPGSRSSSGAHRRPQSSHPRSGRGRAR
jgi:predicted PurR-regulated permease PerM